MRQDYPRGLIQRIAEQFSGPREARRALAEFRRQGGKIETYRWEKMWAEVRNEQRLAGIEEGRDLRFRPTESEIMPMTTVRATGIAQRVTVYGYTPSGHVITRSIDVRTNRPMARWRAMRRAEEIAQEISPGEKASPDTIIQTVIGATYQATYRLSP